MAEAKEILLRFESLAASLLVRHGQGEKHPRGIQFSVRPTEPIAYAGGTSLNEREWNIVVDEGDAPNSRLAAELNALGLLHGPFGNDDDDRAGLISCVIAQRAFEPLLAAVLAGRLPKSISVNVVSAGVTDDTSNRGVIWDTKRDRSPPVMRVDFYTPLIESAAKGAAETETWAPASASAADIQALGKTIRETLLAGHAQVRRYAIAGVIFVLIVLFLRH